MGKIYDGHLVNCGSISAIFTQNPERKNPIIVRNSTQNSRKKIFAISARLVLWLLMIPLSKKKLIKNYLLHIQTPEVQSPILCGEFELQGISYLIIKTEERLMGETNDILYQGVIIKPEKYLEIESEIY